jgi:hypothetical protein
MENINIGDLDSEGDELRTKLDFLLLDMLQSLKK